MYAIYIVGTFQYTCPGFFLFLKIMLDNLDMLCYYIGVAKDSRFRKE